MNANDLLKQMADAYAAARGYADRGVVTSTIVQPNQREVRRLAFLTAFERPHRFRYEFTDEQMDRLVIWQEEPPAQLFWTTQDGVEAMALDMAIASATGISSGSALTIPRLLMPQLEPAWSLTDLEDPVEDGKEQVEDVSCVRIRGRQGGGAVTVWIGAEDLLVRRIFQTRQFGPNEHAEMLANLPEEARSLVSPDWVGPAFDTETETVYVPRKNPVLTAADFAPPLVTNDGQRPS